MRDRSRKLLKLSQRSYTNQVLKRFNVQNCLPGEALIVKGDKYSVSQCPKAELEKDAMKYIPYASAISSLMYAQVCTPLDIAYTVSVLGRFQCNLGIIHLRVAKKVLRYLQCTKDTTLTFQGSADLRVVGYSELILLDV